MYIPTDIQKMILSFLPKKCDWCTRECNYEIMNYRTKIFLDEDREEVVENAYICRLCKLGSFNFDRKFVWIRNFGQSREEDIISLYPQLRVRSYEYVPYGKIVEEPIHTKWKATYVKLYKEDYRSSLDELFNSTR
jgi:hypothetical protein